MMFQSAKTGKEGVDMWIRERVLLDFSLTVKAASHECVNWTSQP